MTEQDWITDETMSADETMRRFADLKPEPTVGPQTDTASPEAGRASAQVTGGRRAAPGR